MGLTRDKQAEDESYLEKYKRRGLSCEPPLDDNTKAFEDAQNSDCVTDNVNHPPHYTQSLSKCQCGRTIECIDVVRHMNFNIGNAIKYLWRCDFKNAPIEDLRKAAFYIQDEIKERLK